MNSFFIDYKKLKTNLCLLGQKYDTDKSSQRNNVSDTNHCHPYTIFYHSLFLNAKDLKLNIAEFGIGGSIPMWKDYFQNSTIWGFDNNTNLIQSFPNSYYIDLQNPQSTKEILNQINKTFDLIIDDTIHEVPNQIQTFNILNKFLNPGGIYIMEDVFIRSNEHDYFNHLAPILNQDFHKHFFITMNHSRKNSTGWNNDKLFVLIKNGEPIFKQTNQFAVITPCSRPNNLHKVKESIDFNHVKYWIIVHDSPEPLNIFPDNPQIIELFHKNESSIYGNAQRNFALDWIQHNNIDTFIYFLDDDNSIHPHFYNIIPFLLPDNYMTFNTNNLKGNVIQLAHIDTAMFIIHSNLCKNKRWVLDKYEADFHFIKLIHDSFPDDWIYIDNTFAYYNNLM
jgi:hypothetical protein